MIKKETLEQLESELELWLDLRKKCLIEIKDLEGKYETEKARIDLLFRERDIIEKNLFNISISLSSIKSAVEARKIMMEIDMIGQMSSTPGKGMIIQ